MNNSVAHQATQQYVPGVDLNVGDMVWKHRLLNLSHHAATLAPELTHPHALLVASRALCGLLCQKEPDCLSGSFTFQPYSAIINFMWHTARLQMHPCRCLCSMLNMAQLVLNAVQCFGVWQVVSGAFDSGTCSQCHFNGLCTWYAFEVVWSGHARHMHAQHSVRFIP
jgi:hypothetical protein